MLKSLLQSFKEETAAPETNDNNNVFNMSLDNFADFLEHLLAQKEKILAQQEKVKKENDEIIRKDNDRRVSEKDEDKRINISFAGNVTTAALYDKYNNVLKKAQAYCCPDDKFNLCTGTIVSLIKFFGISNVIDSVLNYITCTSSETLSTDDGNESDCKNCKVKNTDNTNFSNNKKEAEYFIVNKYGDTICKCGIPTDIRGLRSSEDDCETIYTGDVVDIISDVLGNVGRGIVYENEDGFTVMFLEKCKKKLLQSIDLTVWFTDNSAGWLKDSILSVTKVEDYKEYHEHSMGTEEEWFTLAGEKATIIRKSNC